MQAEVTMHPILPKPVPPARAPSIWAMIRAARDDVLKIFPEAAYREQLVELRFLSFRRYLLSDPDGIGHVLLDNVQNYAKAREDLRPVLPILGNGLFASEGETWRRHRRIMAPSFQSHSLAAYAPVITDVAGDLSRSWAALPSGSVVDVGRAMMQATLQVISQTMFSTESDSIIESVREAFEIYIENLPIGLVDLLPPLAPWLERRRYAYRDRVFARFDERYGALVARRRDAAVSSTGESGDLLSRLIVARDEGGGGMTEAEIRDQVVTIFLAGHETTALALTWTWFLLALHPHIEARLHAELDRVLGQSPPAQHHVPLLVYTRQVIEEAMRLYPPVFSLPARKALADDVVCGTRIAKGSYIAINPWLVHRHALIWDEPDRFDPDRFAPERAASRPRFAFMPFGAGPRICIGAGLAMLEAVLILATLAQRFRLRVAPDQIVEAQAVVALRPRYGLKMVLEPRAARVERAEGSDFGSPRPETITI
jgi:cytochrome P450